MSAAKPTYPLGLAAGFAAAPLLYAIVHVVAMRLHPEADPAATIWTEHSPSITRILVWLYACSALLIGAVSLASAAPRIMPRVIGAAAVLSAIAVFVQAVWAP